MSSMIDTDELESGLTDLGKEYDELQERLERQAIDIRKAKKAASDLQETIQSSDDSE